MLYVSNILSVDLYTKQLNVFSLGIYGHRQYRNQLAPEKKRNAAVNRLRKKDDEFSPMSPRNLKCLLGKSEGQS